MKLWWHWAAVTCGVCTSLAGPAQAEMLIERLAGPVTTNELRAFKEHVGSARIPTNNVRNAMVYGSGGDAVEALGDVFEISGDPEVLDLMLRFTDQMLAARNHPLTGRVIWTGRRELIWPNRLESAPDARYSGPENGDVIAHIAYAAKLILQHRSIWGRQPPGGDPFGFGATCLERAKTYVRELDRTVDAFILRWWVDGESRHQLFPKSELYRSLGGRYAKDSGQPVPWNQQMMLNGAFQRLAECHALLADEPGRVARCDTIVKASLEWFLSEVTTYQVNGHDCCKWSYVAEGRTLRHIEDTGHAAYDLYLYRSYRGGRYGLNRATMRPLANTVAEVLSKGNGQFAWRVDGSGKTRGYLPGTFLYLAEFRPDLYALMANADRERARTQPAIAARILWVKHQRHVGWAAEPAPAKESRPPTRRTR